MRPMMLAGAITISLASFVSQSAWEAPKRIELTPLKAGAIWREICVRRAMPSMQVRSFHLH
jgi:hypothetical protein